MDLDNAIKVHGEWKLKLRTAISAKEQLDAPSIAADNVCPFGKWLHGPARNQYGHLKSYATCLERHKLFHLEAGKVATAINAGKYQEATAMLDGGTPYASASSAVGGAILGLRKEANL
ncbi:chemotaxis protein [Paucibacter sp. KBW04]|uniref:CZB domain-containing protein n=1 Tax=Paucibacter sp. KBW04 TaxID=2153361 RepID=UPI000F574D86|nr:CZB domain-containing protein [Paucibacter sp. KBW04]RQO57316.1 chemotaxis protein [Paucibacter sp. KBW04]